MKILLKLFGTLVTCVAVGIPAAGRAAPAPGKADPLIVRAHFIGSEQLLAAPDTTKLREVWNMPTTASVRNEALHQFSRLPFFWLGVAKSLPAQTNLIRPLVDDLLAHEFYVDATAAPAFVLAAHVPADRAKLWDTNLRQAVAGWKLGTPTDAALDGFKGWEVKKTGAPSTLRFLRAGDWVVVSAGDGKIIREGEVLAAIKSTGRPAKPTGAWLDGDANLARCSGWLPVLLNFENLPIAHFSFSNRAEFVRTYAVLDFAKPHGWKPEPWRVPTGVIRDPLVSFMAIRGVAPVLDAFKDIREVGYKPTPNQIIGWGNRDMPFQLTYVAPSSDVANKLKAIQPKLTDLLLGKSNSRFSGEIEWDANVKELLLRGLPVAAPRLKSARDSGTEFLVLNCFPMVGSTNKAPPELYRSFMGRDDLAAFDFEITGDRIPHWRQFYQILEIGTGRALTPSSAPKEVWFTDLMPKLGEAVTELQVTSPTQMKLMRKSHLGLTAFELVTLGRWIDATNFPAFGIFPEQPPKRPLAKAGAPAGK